MTMPHATSTVAHESLARASNRLADVSLSMKIQTLRQQRSADPIQQAQSDAIVCLYDAVRELQEAIWPILLTIPDVSGARAAAAAAAAGGSGTSAAAVASAALGLPGARGLPGALDPRRGLR